ncbi:thiamine pyrophosphate-dependent dehydrogenase E1 component subunit alpha [Piscinibacter sakaiensis]|uniref:thiamine pyrophosphate-dependent dehydrogenase E1 component subunit alpha n=1 Tax=Piscinibacter sakaiensis TaxID=1547922 RepID=UPI003AAEDCEA
MDLQLDGQTGRPPARSRAASDAARRIALLEKMMLIRAYEQQLAALAGAEIPGTCTAVGQEAVAVGVVSVLRGDDLIVTNHRSAGHLLARGADPGRLMAEVMGRVDGYCRGRSGSLQVSAASLGVVLTSAVVGAGLPLATGVALAQKLGAAPGRGDGSVAAEMGEPLTAVFFGDGAACEGVFHEAVNLAVSWRLPILYVCENNQWQGMVRRDEVMPGSHVADWVRGHGIVAASVDGNDVEAVRSATREAVGHIRASGRPRLLELVTYRQRGDREPDDQAYVDAAELNAWKRRDPIRLMSERLLADALLQPAELACLQQRAEAEVAVATAFARSSPWPGPREVDADVYA